MARKKNTKDSKKMTIVLGIIFTFLVVLVVGMNVQAFYQETKEYVIREPLFTFSNTQSEYLGINENQIIRLTKDGITAYNLQGDTIWADTLTLEHPVVRQRAPYIAISDLNNRVIHLFDDSGRSGEIILDNDVIYFSVTKNGDVAVIEGIDEGHRLTVYNKYGNKLSGERITYIKNAGYPISAEVSNDGQMLIASYIDIYNPQVTSIVIGMPLRINQQEQQEVDNIAYGIEITNNIVYDIEFVTDETWIAIGDEQITYHDLKTGSTINELLPARLTETPYVIQQTKKGYLPIVGEYMGNSVEAFAKQFLWIYDSNAEVILEKQFDQMIDFYRADEKGIIIGQGNHYEGYDEKGRQRFTFISTHNIENIGYINNNLIALTKNGAYKLEIKEEESTQ